MIDKLKKYYLVNYEVGTIEQNTKLLHPYKGQMYEFDINLSPLQCFEEVFKHLEEVYNEKEYYFFTITNMQKID